MPQFTEHFDVVVVGAGHAGCEAAMASARMGLKTALYTLNVDLIAQMSCNPAIGGIAKGHLVREVDALGGIMGEITDAVGIQFRLLNTSRGPAVWSPRAQCDKQAYRLKMREVLESQPNLKIKQAEVADLIVEPCHPERSEPLPDDISVIPSGVEGPCVYCPLGDRLKRSKGQKRLRRKTGSPIPSGSGARQRALVKRLGDSKL
jgi:folate-dependent tRNA-U54 methylase TrmFO/GidA